MDLTALQHSPLLQSLGWAIANSIWQAAVLWIGYYIINATYKSASAKFKTNIATILLSIAFVWFSFTLFDKYFLLINIPDGTLTQANLNGSYTYSIIQLLLHKIAAALPYLSMAYLLLLVFLSIRLLTSYRYTYFIKSRGLQKPSAEWKLFTEKVARHIGINKKIKLWISHHIDVPATIGFLKPVILIPVASINQLSADQLEAIILHELSHIKRNDYLINIIISIIETVLFFNPFIVLLARIIKRERENCCDDFVIQYQYDRHSYASALLSLEQYRNTNIRLAISATSGKKQLLHRVKRIMEIRSTSSFNYGQKLLALLLITGIISSIAWLSPKATETKTSTASNKVETEISVTKIYPTKSSSITSLQSIDSKIKGMEATIVKAFKNKEAKESIPPKIKMIDKKIANKLSQQNKDAAKSDLKSLLASIPRKLISGANISKGIQLAEEDRIKKGSFSLNINSADISAAMQKLESAIKTIDYTTIVDNEKVQKEITQALNGIGKNSKKKTYTKIKAEQVEELKNRAIAQSGVRQLIGVPLAHAQVSGMPSRSLYFLDSMEFRNTFYHENKVNGVQNKNKRPVITGEGRQRRITTPHHPSAHFYYLDNKGKEHIRTAPLLYRAAQARKHNAVKSFEIIKKENCPEDKRGSITVNGKTLHLSDDEKFETSSLDNKISIISGDHIIEIRIDN